jgi:DNA repair protein SbcD/Mre11
LKFLFFTDSHLRDSRPRNRIDDFYRNQFEELNELANLVLEYDVDALLCGGDLLHVPKPSHELIRDLIGWAKYINVPIYSVIGNHDTVGYQMDSIGNNGIGVLFESEAFHELTEKVFEEEKIYIKGINAKVQEDGYGYEIDPKYHGYTKLIVSHNYVIPEESMMFEYMHPKNIPTNADLVLLGHYHHPFDVQIGNTRFINPGALSRWEIDSANRIPMVLLIDITNGIVKIEKIPLVCAKKAEEIFDLQGVGVEKAKEDQLKSFMNSLEQTNFETNDIEQLVLSVGKNQGIADNILNKSLDKIREAKEVLK